MKNLSIFFLLFLMSCANNHPIELYQVILPRTEISRVVDIPINLENIRIEPFTDARTSTPVAILKGKQIQSKTNLTEIVTSSVASTLQTAGFRSSSAGNVSLTGEIRQFFANVEGNFPSQGTAEVVLSMSVKDSNNRRTYTAQYQGSAKAQTVMASRNDISEMLESALESALRQMIKDRQLLSFLKMKQAASTGKGSASYNTDLYW